MNNDLPNLSSISVNLDTETTRNEIKNFKVDLLKRPPLLGNNIALSASESDNLAQIGLSELHFKDLIIEINRYLLSAGASLSYGGDLRANGLTEILIELVDQFKFSNLNCTDRLMSYLSFPNNLLLTKEDEARFAHRIKFIKSVPPEEILSSKLTAFAPKDDALGNYIWARSLTYMREKMAQECDARILIGGRSKNFKGRAPGVLEELLIALNTRTPIYLIGGFGGVVSDVCAHLNCKKPLITTLEIIKTSAAYQEMKREYLRHDVPFLMNWSDQLVELLSGGWNKIAESNGLTEAENQQLSVTLDIYEINYYVLKGLVKYLKIAS